MKILISLLFLLLSFASYAQIDSQVVDIGFRDIDKHIVIELTTANGVDAVKFGLGSNTSGKSVPISKCAYSQSSLEDEIGRIDNPKVKRDFSWIFLRSDYSGTTIEQFYPEFKALLERANPKCPVQDLQPLKDQLNRRNG